MDKKNVRIRLFKDNSRYKGDLFVSVNGVSYKIRRGVEVEVPPEVMKVEDFEAVGGFDEEFVVAFNDIDLCMKERAAGKKVVFTQYAELYHYESKFL